MRFTVHIHSSCPICGLVTPLSSHGQPCPLVQNANAAFTAALTGPLPTISSPISVLVPSGPLVRPHLDWWLRRSNHISGQAFPHPQPTLTITTDASNHSWGAHVGMDSVAGMWAPEEMIQHINVLELLAVRRTLTYFQQTVMGYVVLVKSDIRRPGSSSHKRVFSSRRRGSRQNRVFLQQSHSRVLHEPKMSSSVTPRSTYRFSSTAKSQPPRFTHSFKSHGSRQNRGK